MGANEKELLDQYVRHLNRLDSAVIEHSKGQFPVITAIEKDRSGVREIQEQFEISSGLQQLKLEKDEARKAFDESGPHEGEIAQRADDWLKLDKLLDAAVEDISTRLPINVGIGGVFAFERDPSGEEIDGFLETLFRVNFATQRVVIRGEEDPARLARHLGHQVAFKLVSRDGFNQAKTFCGKGRAYFANTLRNEHRRIIRDEEIEDRNHLGGTPKESRHLSDDDCELIRALNRTAAEIDDPTTAVALSNSENPEEILLAQEEEEEWGMGADLDQFSGQLPSDQRALLECWRAGESPTDARRRLDLPKSTETALRNRLKRWGHELRA